jgi:hypothetical protein
MNNCYKNITLLVLTVVALIGVPEALAYADYLDTFRVYGSAVDTRIFTCKICHINSSGGGPTNPYGTDFANKGHSFKAIEPLDSDGDGFINIDEIYNLTFPGDASDNPATPPVITILGNTPEIVVIGSVYTDAGATAIDAVDGPVPVSNVTTVNTEFIGSYTVTYTATDAAGNTATAIRTVYVVAADTTAPVINSVTLSTTTPNTGDAINVTVNATDDVGVTSVTANGVPLALSGGVWVGTITAIEGTHTVDVMASDAAGNFEIESTHSYTAITHSVEILVNGVLLINVSASHNLTVRYSNFSSGDASSITIKRDTNGNFSLDPEDEVVYTQNDTLDGSASQIIHVNWIPERAGQHWVVANGKDGNIFVTDIQPVWPVPEVATVVLVAVGMTGLMGVLAVRKKNGNISLN